MYENFDWSDIVERFFRYLNRVQRRSQQFILLEC